MNIYIMKNLCEVKEPKLKRRKTFYDLFKKIRYVKNKSNNQYWVIGFYVQVSLNLLCFYACNDNYVLTYILSYCTLQFNIFFGETIVFKKLIVENIIIGFKKYFTSVLM